MQYGACVFVSEDILGLVVHDSEGLIFLCVDDAQFVDVREKCMNRLLLSPQFGVHFFLCLFNTHHQLYLVKHQSEVIHKLDLVHFL